VDTADYNFQAECREFESRPPLHIALELRSLRRNTGAFLFKTP